MKAKHSAWIAAAAFVALAAACVVMLRADRGAALKPSRQIALEQGKAPNSIAYAHKLGLAYVACLGRRRVPHGDQLAAPEAIAINTKTGQIVARTSFDHLLGLQLSPDERYLALISYEPDAQTSRTGIYHTGDLAGQVMSLRVPAEGNRVIDNEGTLYRLSDAEGSLERIDKGEKQTLMLQRPAADMCWGIDGRVLYLSVWGSEYQSDEPPGQWPPATLLVIDPKTLKAVQVVPLPGHIAADYMTLWKQGKRLVCGTDRGLVTIPIAADGSLVPKDISQISSPTGLLAIDEDRSLAYGFTTPRSASWRVHVVDLHAGKLLGTVPISGNSRWDQPKMVLSTATDELWICTKSADQIMAYSVGDLIRRAR